ncbi:MULTISPECIES: DUF11 domain-containing protein [Paenibacillus]|uniref:DUF11 domain-containing protein n=1 Tax=Paenibacillus TaxID=44249 RepID=UPI00096DA9C7|nr:DUF11 domain-containing protein [Paenibacillus amylolyticus]OMF47605.1 hypothetical protein BK136_01550 [Paenibacillus amylolyticus]
MSQSSGPLSHWLKNQSLVRFSSGATELEQVSYSNTVVTPWIGPRLEVRKVCNITEAALGQSLIYRVEIVNTGNLTALVYLLDQLSSETALLPNSVLRDGIPLPGASPERGLPPAEIAPGATLRYHFQVVILRLPETLKLLNQAQVNYEFLTPEGRSVTGMEQSNIVEVNLVSSRLEISFQADHIYTFSGDIVMYTVIVSNPGFIAAPNAQVTISLPQGIVFIPASVIVDEMFAPQVTPDTGIQLGEILPGSSIRIQYRVQVTGGSDAKGISSVAVLAYISAGQQEMVYSNQVTLEVIQPQVSVVKSVLPVTATLGDAVQYNITVSNASSYAVDGTLLDVLPTGMTFVEGSLRWNGVKRPGTNLAKGLNLGTLTARSVLNIQFEAKLPDRDESMPDDYRYVNHASLMYTFRLPDSRSVQRMITSNEAVVELKAPIIQAYVQVTPTLVEQGGTVTFQVRVGNTGNLPARVQLGSILPEGARWLGQATGQLQLSISEYSTPRVLHVGVIEPGTEKNISYVAKLASEKVGTLQGDLIARYTYEWNGQKRAGETRSNEYSIIVEYREE